MTKTELKEALEKYTMESKRIQLLSSASLFKETTAEQEARVKRLLKPENYLDFFEYYYGVNSLLALADAPCAKFHLTSYLELFKNPLIKQQRRWFRGAAKSIHTNVGNLCHLKENNEVNFGLIIGRTLDAGKLLLSDVQMHLESNERYIKDFGMQMQYGSWADGQFETNDKKMFKALGLNQPFRGLRNGAWRPDFASMDDLEDRKQAKNIDLTKENVQKLTGDLGKAGQKGRFRQVMANNYIVKNGIVDGYAEINRKWQKGDLIELELPIQPRIITAHTNTKDLSNTVCIASGPIIYCFEDVDNPDFKDFRLDTNAPLEIIYQKDLLNGVNIIKSNGKTTAIAIPYYSITNRKRDSSHKVWVPKL